MKIFIDVGHGGSDSGAINSVVKEKEINLNVGLKLAELLRYNGFEVKMCRDIDAYIDLNVRVDMANSWGADLYISVHHNAGGGDGYEVYHSIYLGKGKTLAGYVSDEFKALGQNYRFVGFRESGTTKGTDYYYVIKYTNMPAIITEYAFIDTIDYNAIDTQQEQINEAYAIAKAVCKFAGVVFKDNIAIEETHWCDANYNYLQALGCGFDTKNYDSVCTRAEVFAMLVKYHNAVS